MVARRALLTAGLSALGVALATAGLPQLVYPPWFDQGAFAACGQILNRGGVFLRDCWDVRGPLTPMLYAFALRFSESSHVVFMLNLVWQAASAGLLGVLSWRITHSRAATLTGPVLYWLMHATLNYWSVAQAEGFANLAFITAAWCAWEGRQLRHRAPGWWLAAGLCSGALFWFKYPFAAFALLLMLWTTLTVRQRPALRSALGSLVAGWVVAIVAGGLYFVANQAGEALIVHLRYALANFHGKPLDERWEWLSSLFWVELTTFARIGSTPTAGFKDTIPQGLWLGRGFPLIVALVGLGAVRTLVNARLRAAGGLALLWLLGGVLLNIWQGHSYRYHFVIWLPPMALVAGLTTAGWQGWTGRAWQAATLSLAGLAAVAQYAAILPWMQDAAYQVLIAQRTLRHIHIESKQEARVLLAEFLADKLTPDQRVAIFSDTPEVHLLAQRSSATRFPYVRWADESRDPSVREWLARAYLADLQRTKPAFFILTRDGFPWAEARFIETWKALPEVAAFVESNYTYIGENGPYLLFAQR
ncbi:MAG: hypothetical protein ACK4WM_01195 [Thermoflexales bacterium]